LPPNISEPGVEAGGSGGSLVSDGGIIPPPKDSCVENPAPSPDAQGLCGNMFLDITTDAPNLFFVLDRSGSMSEVIDRRTKYDSVALAAVSLVRSLGSQANVGAAVFPGTNVGADGCGPGDVVFPPKPGDSINQAYCGDDGPVTRAFSRAISLKPAGATPTADTLRKLLPILTGLKGRTYVLLATDGGPNCNYGATCGADKCIFNIEGAQGCTAGVNCCDPLLGGPENCLDEDGTKAAVVALHAAGIKTYVIGIPGSVPYAELLNELAIAGGTARVGATSAYYDVQFIPELDDVLGSIGATVTLSCEVHLAAPPPDSGLVNVYLDGQPVKYGTSGWLWGPVGADAAIDADDASIADDASDEAPTEAAVPHTEIDLVGDSCDMLKSGKFRRLQVVFGCPTDIPR
jgi:hypothetical protein